MSKKRVAIVIPIYTDKFNEQEKISLSQAESVFQQFDMIAVSPEGLNLNNQIFFKVEYFSKYYFESVTSYNALMLSVSFYKRFQDYEYILIYQLDAFVFSNQLLSFCDLEYDYIGAPWLHGLFHYVDEENCIWYVGNGGLSLRRVNSCIRVLQKFLPLQHKEKLNEDLFFSSVKCDYFTVAPVEVALQFAFEKQVERCYALNNNSLPFGCHAWARYNYSFWKPYIEKYGYNLNQISANEDEDFALAGLYEFFERYSYLWNNKDLSSKVRKYLLDFLPRQSKGYVLFGCGYWGIAIEKWFTAYGIPIMAFSDNNVNIQNRKIDNYTVIKPKNLVDLKDNIILIALYEHCDSVQEQLDEMGLKYGQNFITLFDLMKEIGVILEEEI